MTVLFGHPIGNPNAHHAALAHLEANRLEAFCVPWMPSRMTLRFLEHIGALKLMARRLGRRHFPPLVNAPLLEGKIGELRRLIIRVLDGGDERISYEANDWLMRTMLRECRRPAVTAVHAYEDCSLWQFAEAKRLGKACIYDMPIGYYPAWEQTHEKLARQYVDWLPGGDLPSSRFVRSEQKRQEMDLADLVLVPSTFVATTVHRFHSGKQLALTPYGIDTVAWSRSPERLPRERITFLFAGPCSLRKGIPLLLEAWRAARLRNARLQLVGSWQLAEAKKRGLAPEVEWVGPVSKDRLREHYRQAEVFVLPTNFEGRALVVGEALSSGLPVIATSASGAEDLIDDTCGRLIPTANFDALVESLRWFENNREKLPAMSRAARLRAERCRWEHYRRCVTEAVAPFV